MSKTLLIVIAERNAAADAIGAIKLAGECDDVRFVATGSGVREVVPRFIDKLKTVIWSVVSTDKVDAIMDNLVVEARLDSPGRGVAFTIPITHTLEARGRSLPVAPQAD